MRSTSSKGVASAMTGHRMLIAEIGAPDLFVLPDRRRRAGSDHPPVDQNGDAVGERDGEFELALLAVAQSGDEDVGAMPKPDPIQRSQRGLAEVAFLSGVAP